MATIPEDTAVAEFHLIDPGAFCTLPLKKQTFLAFISAPAGNLSGDTSVRRPMSPRGILAFIPVYAIAILTHHLCIQSLIVFVFVPNLRVELFDQNIHQSASAMLYSFFAWPINPPYIEQSNH